MDAATRDLLYQNINNLADLGADQQAQIVAAIEAYDFGADAEASAWQDEGVTALKSGDWKPDALARLVTGAIDFAKCA
jgi:hypothetical protein